MLNELWAYCGVASFVVTWAAIVYVLHKNPRELNKSISHHAAQNSNAYRRFAVLMSLALCLLAVYVSMHLAPTYNLPIMLVGLFAVALLMEFITTWIPLAEDRKFHPHNILSHGTALLMPIIIIGMVLYTPLSSSARIIAYLGLLIMASLLVAFFVVPKARRVYLLCQSIYIIAFQIPVVLIPLLV